MLNLNTQSLYIPFTTFKKLEDRFNVYIIILHGMKMFNTKVLKIALQTQQIYICHVKHLKMNSLKPPYRLMTLAACRRCSESR